ncbi:MAG TPA: sialidase family protein [Streptosporangiaceae bacterium]|nr:sialidase family protein [Streptosporangiaceae bacterium]
MSALRSVRRPRAARLAARAAPIALGLVLVAGTAASAAVSLTRVSGDVYTDAQAQHRTEVEPDTFAFGSTIVSAFQVGRVFGGGASNIGWATSRDGGATWSHGYLPGITGNGGGPFGQASDASVAYDAKHKVWLISSLGIGGSAVDVLVSRSTKGGVAWGKPVTVATGSNDKNWIVCDNTATSPHFGNCYMEYDVTSGGDSVVMQTSTDGGLTWGPARAPGGGATGLGGQPVVQPSGTVVVPYESIAGGEAIRSFASTNGGASWGATVVVASIRHHGVAGSLRESPLPSAAVDGAGKVYVTWADCRFRTGCTSNDIVLAKSTGPGTWAAPVRVPIDPVTSTVDHFVPGVAVDASTSGSTARIGLTYYYYPNASCSSSTCKLDAGFISSVNGGATWSAPAQIAGPMSLSWLPSTSEGIMFGDYIATAVVAGGNAYPVIPVSRAPAGSVFHQAMYVPAGGLAVAGGSRLASAAHSHPFPPQPAPRLPVTAR